MIRSVMYFSFLTITFCCLLNLAIFAQETERDGLAIEFPELNSGKLSKMTNHIARSDLSIVKFWILNPAAETIDWSKITVSINGKAANASCKQNAAAVGKVMLCDLNRLFAIGLDPKENLLEIKAESQNGKIFYASFRVIVDPSKSAPAPSLGFSGRKFAVVIGVSKYEFNDRFKGTDYLYNLDYADNDADELNKWLREKGGFIPDNILHLTNKQATLSTVRDSAHPVSE